MTKFDLGKLLIENREIKSEIVELKEQNHKFKSLLSQVYSYLDVDNEGVSKEAYEICEKIRRVAK